MTLVLVALRNLWRNRFRTLLTVLAVTVAVLSFVLFRTVITAWSTAADFAPKDRLITRHKVSFVMPLPHRYVEVVRQLPGIRTVSFASFFGGREPSHDKEVFLTWAADRNYLEVFNEFELPPAQKAAWREDRTGLIVGDVLARKLGWKLGDRVTLESGIFPAPPDAPWTFTVRGIYTARSSSVDRSTVLVRWDYINDSLPEGRRDEVGWISLRVTDASRAADVAAALDARFASEEVQTQTQDEKSFQAGVLAMSGAVLEAIGAVSLVMLLIMVLLLGNTTVMNVAERWREYSVLRALGFSPAQVSSLVLGEAALLAGVGGLLGTVLSYPLIERGIGSVIEQNLGSLLPHFRIAPTVAVAALLSTLAAAILVAAIPAYRVSRGHLVDGLRRVS